MPVLLLLLLAACGGGAHEDDCMIVKTDRAHALLRVGQAALERCLAPTGSTCERVEQLAIAAPAMVPHWAKLDRTNVKAVCTAMPAALQPCMFPSYVVGHIAECQGAPAAARAAVVKLGAKP